MPFVKWRLIEEDLTPEHEIPVGKSILQLNDIRTSANYTCVASSSLGVIEANAMVKVQCKSPDRTLILFYNLTILNVHPPQKH